MIRAEKLESVKKEYLPLNLQFHASDDGGADDDQGADDKQDNQGNDDDKKDDTDPDKKDADKKATKTFSQEEVNAIAAKEAKKAMDKVLKQIGMKDATSAKEALDKYNQLQEDQKTDAQKAIDKAKALETDNGTVTKENETLKAELSALKADVNPEFLSDVVVLAKTLVTDEVDMDAAIKLVIVKYPNFKREVKKDTDIKPKPKFSTGDHKDDGKDTNADAWKNAFNWGRTTEQK